MNNISPSPPPDFRPAKSSKGKEKEIPDENKTSQRKRVPKQIEKAISPRIVSNADGSLKERRATRHFREELEVASLASANLQTSETSAYQHPAEPKKWLPGELKEKAQERDLKLIKKKQADSLKSHGPHRSFTADALGDSANPVGLMKKPVYFSRSSLTKNKEYPTFPMIAEIIKKAHIGLRGPRSRVDFKQKALWQLNNHLYKVYENNNLSTKEKFEHAQLVFASFKQNYLKEEEQDSYEFRGAILQLEKEFLKILPLKPESMEQVPTLYSKDEVLSQLSIQLMDKRITQGKAQTIIELKKDLLASPDAFISQDALELILESYQIQIKPALSEYVSSFDVLATLGNTPIVRMQIAKSLGDIDHPGYALKLGNETKRELLARKILHLFGFEKTFYHLKTEANLPQTRIKGRSGKDAIASRIIEAMPIGNNRAWLSAWNGYQKAEQRLHAAQFEGSSAEELKELQQNRNTAAMKLRRFGGAESIPTHVLMSALLGGYDEHLGQFIPDAATRELIDIDFSRFLPPASYLQSRDSKTPETFFIFRNIFLNHPLAKDSLPVSLVRTIGSWDLQNMQKAIAPMVGDQEAMEADYRKLQEVFQDIGTLKKYDSALLEEESDRLAVAELLVKYGISTTPNPQFTTEQEKQLYQILIQESNRLRLNNFDYIHYQGAQELLIRMDTLQKYVASTATPTAYGAFAAMYPEIMPFIEYLQRIPKQSEVGEDISMYQDKGQTKSRPLESILQQAENRLKNQFTFEEEAASAEERLYRQEQTEKLQAQIDAMKRSLDIMRAQPRYRDELALVMDLS